MKPAGNTAELIVLADAGVEGPDRLDAQIRGGWSKTTSRGQKNKTTHLPNIARLLPKTPKPLEINNFNGRNFN